MNNRVFTKEAMQHCSEHGHAWSWRQTWGSAGYLECSRCGETGPVCQQSEQVQPVQQPAPITETSEPGDGRSVAAETREGPLRDRDRREVDGETAMVGRRDRSDVASHVRVKKAARKSRRQGRWEDAGTGEVFTSMAARDDAFRRLAAAGVTQLEIAARFNLTSQRVNQVCRKKTTCRSTA